MRYIIAILLGALVGAALVYATLVGAPAARPAPGEPIAAPDPSGVAPGTVVLRLDQPFFNELLGTIFTELGAPAFPLGNIGATRDRTDEPRTLTVSLDERSGARFMPAALQQNQQGGCANRLTIRQEGSGVQTAVRFVNGQITAPLAFQGEYALPLVGCRQFSGWAQTNIALRFDRNEQTLYGQINVEGVSLEGLNPVVGNFVTPVVQNAINSRVNPIRILSTSQLTLAVPIAATGGTLQAQVTDVRAEIQDALRLFITYDFNGQR